MNNISLVVDKAMCTGCTVCSGVCPVSCISIISNDEGFPEPYVDAEKCTECGVCLKKCHAKNPAEKNPIIAGRLMAATDGREFALGASGGVFGSIARYCLENDFVVYGCAFDASYRAVHIRIDDVEGVSRLQGSKYVQSDTSHVFESVMTDLEAGLSVLFCGTPCQVGALKKISGDYSESLFTVDLVCHGVPSPKFWEEHLESIKEGLSSNSIRDIRFRTKSKFDRFGYALDIWTSNEQIHTPFQSDIFYFAFINNYSLRPCCYSCEYASSKRVSDITLGDCGSIDDYPTFEKVGLGSIVLANTQKGIDSISELERYTKSEILDVRAEIKANAQLREPSKRPKARAEFYRDLQSMNYNDFVEKYMPSPSRGKTIVNALKSRIPWRMKKKLKSLLRK